MSGEPRAHLYVFAHRALPTLGLHHSKQMLGALCGPKCSVFFAAVWNDIRSKLDPSERVEFPEIACTSKRRGDFLIAPIQFPKPTRMTEPHFSAFVFGPIRENESLDKVAARYFILEHSMDLGGGPRTVLGEWTTESHRNYGDGPAAAAEPFEEAVWKATLPAPV